MIRSAASKVLWVGRATVFLVGLAVILALMFGVASTALGAVGESFILGRSNDADDRATGLTSSVADALKATLVLRNTGGTSPLSLKVTDSNTTDPAQKSVAPMKVDSQAKVTNLNADELDGKDSFQFLGRTEKAADSDKLDDIDSTGFVRSQANALDMAPGANNGEVLRFFNPNVILDIDVYYHCPSTLTNNGSLNIVNRSSSETINVFSDNGGDNPNAYTRLGPSQNFAQDAAASGEHITLQAQGARHMATIEVFSVHRASALGTGTDDKCHIEAQGLFSQGFFTQ